MNEKEIYMNYKRNNKWLGIIDYKSLTFLVIYIVITWNILSWINIRLEYKVYIFVCLSIPIIVLLFVNIDSESAIDVVLTMIKYKFKNKIYVNNYLYVKDVDKTCKIFSIYNKKT